MITAPISSNQIKDVAVDFECLEPTCKDLNSVLKAIDEKFVLLGCEGVDFGELDFGCVDTADDMTGTLQNILSAIDGIGCSSSSPGSGSPSNVLSNTITGLLYCSTDSWECNRADACFTIENNCDPGTITLSNVLQALLNRNVAYGNVIKDLCERLSELEDQTANLQLQVNVIQSSCCG